MIAFADFRATLKQSTDYRQLRAYLQQLVGQPFLFARFSYGDELTLHFGQARPYKSSKMGNLSKGEYIIGARASSWFWKTASPPGIVIGTDDAIVSRPKGFALLSPNQVETTNFVRPKSRIVSAETIKVETRRRAYGFGLLLLLEESTFLWIRPAMRSSRTVRSIELADWEIFTPYDRYFAVGPGRHWSYLPSRKTSADTFPR